MKMFERTTNQTNHLENKYTKKEINAKHLSLFSF
jgi:hypothetical protein